MTIIVENKHTLIFDDFKFKCCVGKMDFQMINMREIKEHQLVNMLQDSQYRKDRKKPKTKLKVFEIKNMVGVMK